MSISHQETQTGTATSSSSVATASMTSVAGDRYVCAIATRNNVSVGSVAGLGLTWTLGKAQCAARGQQRIEIWNATGTPTGNGAVTATLVSPANAACIVASRYSGADAPTTTASYNTLGSGGACTGGTDNNDAQGNITTAATNSLVWHAVDSRNRNFTTTTGWNARATNITAGTSGDITTLSVEDKVVASAASTALGQADNLSGTADWALAAEEFPETVADDFGADFLQLPPGMSMRSY